MGKMAAKVITLADAVHSGRYALRLLEEASTRWLQVRGLTTNVDHFLCLMPEVLNNHYFPSLCRNDWDMLDDNSSTYSGASEQRIHWEQAFCLLKRGVPIWETDS